MEPKMEKIMESVAGLMALSARTAPKGKGDDYLEIKILSGSEVDELSKRMIEFGEETGKPNFDRDGKNVAASEAVVLLALKDSRPLALNCGACGYSSCTEMEKATTERSEFQGPLCNWRVMDLGIALGSAVKTASLLNADNRIMYRIGAAARKAGFLEGELAVGVPLSGTGKSIYFDR